MYLIFTILFSFWGSPESFCHSSFRRQFGVSLCNQTQEHDAEQSGLFSTQPASGGREAVGISGQCHPTAICSFHMGSRGKQGLFMLGDNSCVGFWIESSWNPGVSHLFLNVTEHFK